MSATGRGGDRRPDDNYSTPAWCARAILPHLRIWDGTTILDPCCGKGAIFDTVEAYCDAVSVESRGIGLVPNLVGIEIDRKRSIQARSRTRERKIVCADALTLKPWPKPKPNLILTNPPYSLALEFLNRSLDEVSKDGEVAFLLRIGFLGSKERMEWHRVHTCDIYQLSKRPEFCASLKCKDKCAGTGQPGWQKMQEIDAPRPKACPKCGGKVTVSTSDASEYAFFVYGRNRGISLPTGERCHRLFLLGEDEKIA